MATVAGTPVLFPASVPTVPTFSMSSGGERIRQKKTSILERAGKAAAKAAAKAQRRFAEEEQVRRQQESQDIKSVLHELLTQRAVPTAAASSGPSTAPMDPADTRQNRRLALWRHRRSAWLR